MLRYTAGLLDVDSVWLHTDLTPQASNVISQT